MIGRLHSLVSRRSATSDKRLVACCETVFWDADDQKLSMSASYPQVQILVLGTTLGSNAAGQKTESRLDSARAIVLPCSFSITLEAYALFDDCGDGPRCAVFEIDLVPVHVFSGCPNSPWTKIMLCGIKHEQIR
jgi:hypothetical protein